MGRVKESIVIALNEDIAYWHVEELSRVMMQRHYREVFLAEVRPDFIMLPNTRLGRLALNVFLPVAPQVEGQPDTHFDGDPDEQVVRSRIESLRFKHEHILNPSVKALLVSERYRTLVADGEYDRLLGALSRLYAGFSLWASTEAGLTEMDVLTLPTD